MNSVFIDTSAFFALLDIKELNHPRAKEIWVSLRSRRAHLVTSNYVQCETISLVQARLGLEAVRVYENSFSPLIETKWVTEPIHRRGLDALLLANRRKLSLVDCISFQIMRDERLKRVFCFDAHFEEQGFAVLGKSGHGIG